MQYIQNTILKNEKLVYWARPHWIIFAPAAISILLALILISYGPALLGSLAYFQLFGLYFYQLFAILVILFGIYNIISAYINYQTSEYGITDKRILMKTGWIQRNSLEVFLDKIEAVRVGQSILGRILNYGTLIIVGTGGTEDPFFNIPDPLSFRKQVQQQIDLYERSRSGLQ